MQRAEKYAHLAGRFCSFDCPDTLKVLDLRFRIYHALDQHALCWKSISQALSHPQVNTADNARDRWTFYKALLCFATREHQRSQNLLNQVGDLGRHKSEFFLEHRLLELFNLIALEEYDLLEYKVESFRKLLEYHEALSDARMKAVLQFLRAFVREGCDYQALSKRIALFEQEPLPSFDLLPRLSTLFGRRGDGGAVRLGKTA